MSKREYNLIDCYDELRRIGPQIGAAIRELDRLCERLPQSLVERIQEAVPETTADLAAIGPKLSAFAQTLADEVDALPEARQDALVEQIEARRRQERERMRGLAWGDPTGPAMRGADVLPVKPKSVAAYKLALGQVEDDGEAA